MYYLLNERYRLCGWDKLPYAVVDRKYGSACVVTKPVMDTLDLCNGKIDFSIPLISNEQRDIAQELLKEGIICQCEPGAELKNIQKYRLYDNRYMQTVHWSVTGRCNCKCKHCYISGADDKYGELSHNDVMKIIDDMGNCGVLNCTLTGGEALIRSDFWDIVDGILERDIRIFRIYSNGFLVNETFLNGLKERGISPEINMSFDGTGTHDWLRGITGAEKAVRKAFLLCRDMGIPTGAEMCLWKGNSHTLRQSINDLADMGCSNLKVTPVTNTGAWKEGGYGETDSLSEEELFSTFYEYLDDFYEDLPRMLVHLGGFFLADGNNPDHFSLPAVHCYNDPLRASICVHARNDLYISAEGRAETCMAMSSMPAEFQSKFPLIQERGLKECLTDSAYMKLIDTRSEEIIERNEKCRACRYRTVCLGGCRAGAVMYHPEEILSSDEMVCKMYRDGWVSKIIDKVTKLQPNAKSVEAEIYKKM